MLQLRSTAREDTGQGRRRWSGGMRVPQAEIARLPRRIVNEEGFTVPKGATAPRLL